MCQLDVTIDYLAYTAPRYPLGVRLAAFQSYLRVAVERTPWDSGTSKLDTEVDFDGAGSCRSVIIRASFVIHRSIVVGRGGRSA